MKIRRSIATLGACLIVLLSAAFVQRPALDPPAGNVDLVRHYGGRPIALDLDPTRIAVFVEGDFNSRSVRAAVEPLGIASLDVQRHYAPGWSLARIPQAAATRDGVKALVRDAADVADIHFATPVFLDANGDPKHPTRDVIVRFHPHVTQAAALNAIRNTAPHLPVDRIDINWAGMSNVYRLRRAADNGFDSLNLANTFAVRDDTVWSEADWMVTVTPHGGGGFPNDPSFPDCWGHNNTGENFACGSCLGWSAPPGIPGMDMSMLDAWQITTGDPSIIVAVFDNGIDQTHPDINQITPGYDFVNDGGDGGPWTDCDGHGTPVAGAVAAIMNNTIGGVGVAPDSRVISMKIWNSGGDGCDGAGIQWSWVIEGLEIAQNIGARITNHSYSWSLQSSAVEDKFAETRAAGMVHFASSGNGTPQVPGGPNFGQPSINYPSSIQAVNSVAALDPDGTLTGFSNWGTGLFISAPGVGVCGTGACFCGTSASAPTAAGVAALILSVRPELSAGEVDLFLAFGARDLGAPGYDTTYGWGFVNARDSLILALGCEAVPGADPPTGTCFEANASPGCSNGFCCAKVCAQDPFCCASEWDTLCAQQAINLCLPCPSDGSCADPHGGVGCDDASCCQKVCLEDSFCCNDKFGWDDVCVAIAIDLCGLSPDNDLCVNAQPITDGFTPFTVTAAGNDGPNHHDECGWDVLFTKDVWFEYEATCTGEVTVSTCGSAPFQTWVGVYPEPAGAPAPPCPPQPFHLMECATASEGCANQTAKVTVEAIAGRTYLIRVGAALPTQGSGTLQVSCKPQYDDCEDALDLGGFTGTIQFSNVGATMDGPILSGCAEVYGDIWYDWTAPCTGTLTVSTCDQASFSTKLAVHAGCDCGSLATTMLGCNNNFIGCAGGTSKLSVPVLAGECYKIRVGGSQFSNPHGSGLLTLECEPGGPPNELCENASPAFVGVPLPFSNVLAATDGPQHPQCGPQIVRDVWFHHTAECTGKLRVTTCGTATFDARMALYDGCACPATEANLLQCSDLGPQCNVNGSFIDNVPVIAGQCYLLRVGGDPTGPQSTGTGSIEFFCIPDDPPCPADLTGDGNVGVADLLSLLAAWGPCANCNACPADFDGNCDVGVADLLALLAAWGPCE